MRTTETKQLKNPLHNTINIGDVVSVKTTNYKLDKPIMLYRKDVGYTMSIETDVTIHQIERCDAKYGLALGISLEYKITLEHDVLPCKDCSIWFEDEECFVFLPNVKKIEESVGKCCSGKIYGEKEDLESHIVFISKEQVFRNQVKQFMAQNEPK